MKTLIKNNREIEVSADGKICLDKKEMKQYSDKDGYKQISIYHRNENKMFKVHRLVAEAYHLNPFNKPCVNHIDSNKSNNDFNNLEWVTASENLKHSYDANKRVSPMKGKKGMKIKISKEVLQISLDGFILKEFNSATHAYLETGINRQNICQCRCGTRKTAGGYLWI